MREFVRSPYECADPHPPPPARPTPRLWRMREQEAQGACAVQLMQGAGEGIVQELVLDECVCVLPRAAAAVQCAWAYLRH